MDKFTLFELHVHDGMEFNATNTAPAIGETAEEYVDASDAADEADEDATAAAAADESSRSLLSLVVAVAVLAVVAVAARKLFGSDTELEIAELDDLVDETDDTYEDADAEL
jgi:hypothetical protein